MTYNQILNNLARRENVTTNQIEREKQIALKQAGIECTVKEFIECTTKLIAKR